MSVLQSLELSDSTQQEVMEKEIIKVRATKNANVRRYW